MFYFLTWVLVTWACLFYENSLSSHLVHSSVCVSEFDSFKSLGQNHENILFHYLKSSVFTILRFRKKCLYYPNQTSGSLYSVFKSKFGLGSSNTTGVRVEILFGIYTHAINTCSRVPCHTFLNLGKA